MYIHDCRIRFQELEREIVKCLFGTWKRTSRKKPWEGSTVSRTNQAYCTFFRLVETNVLSSPKCSPRECRAPGDNYGTTIVHFVNRNAVSPSPVGLERTSTPQPVRLVSCCILRTWVKPWLNFGDRGILCREIAGEMNRRGAVDSCRDRSRCIEHLSRRLRKTRSASVCRQIT